MISPIVYVYAANGQEISELTPIEFKSFQLKGELREKQEEIQNLQIENSSFASEELANEYQEVTTINKTSNNILSKTISKSTITPIVSDIANAVTNEDEDNIFTQIVNNLTPQYGDISSGLLSTLYRNVGEYNLGVENFSGITWQKPFGNFAIGVDRQVAPDLFDDQRWIVTDTFAIRINAFSFLHNLKEQGLIDITSTQLAAYAGIEFKREYRYVHFAQSYNEGLTSEMEKLFFGFLKMRNADFSNLMPYEFIEQKDYISVQVGAGGSIPIYSGVGLNFGVMAKYFKLSSISVNAIGAGDNPATPDEYLRISVEKEKGVNINAEINLAGEFFELLKLTLIGFEYDYSYSEAEKAYYSFKQNDKNELAPGGALNREVSNLLKFKKVDPVKLYDYEVSREDRINEDMHMKYRILILSGLKKSQTEQKIFHLNDGTVTSFFVNNSQNTKYIDGIFSTLLNGIAQKFLQTNLFTKFKLMRNRQLSMEYKGEYDFEHFKNFSLENDGKNTLSLKIVHELAVKKTTGIFDKSYKDSAATFVKKLTTLPTGIQNDIEKERIIGPISIQVNSEISREGLIYFNNLNNNNLKIKIGSLCGLTPENIYNQEHYSVYNQPAIIERYRLREEISCFKEVLPIAEDYKKALSKNNKMVLFKLKSFLSKVNKYTDNKNDYIQFFGENNVFINGTINAKLKNGAPYVNYFKGGKVQSLGVIDEYMHNHFLSNGTSGSSHTRPTTGTNDLSKQTRMPASFTVAEPIIIQ